MSMLNIYSIYSHLGMLGLLNWIPDSQYLRIQYRLKLHKKLHLDAPISMNEKLQWLKLHDRNPFYSELVDKYLVRTHMEKLIGRDYLVPLLGVWDNPSEIQFESLPDQFVLKCNHDSGGVIICKDKSKLDTHKVVKSLQMRIRRSYCWGNREWPYKNVKPLIIAEQYIADSIGAEGLTDYKFYCFNGKPDCVLTCLDRKPGSAKFLFFDKEWKRLDYNFQSKEEKARIVSKPDMLDHMYAVAEKIALYVDAPFVRVDLFNSEQMVYFGEITFFPHSGMDATLKPEIDFQFGEMIKLPIR